MFDDAFLIGVATQDHDAQAHERQVPHRPVGHRHPQGRQGDEQVGQRGAQVHAGPRRVRIRSCKTNVPKKYWASFVDNVPRQGQGELRVPGRQGSAVGLLGRVSTTDEGAAAVARPLPALRMSLLASFDWAAIWDNRGAARRGALADDSGLRDRDRPARRRSASCSARSARTASRSLTQLAAVYVEIIRNTPILVQIFLLFYGLPTLSPHLGFVRRSRRALVSR